MNGASHFGPASFQVLTSLAAALDSPAPGRFKRGKLTCQRTGAMGWVLSEVGTGFGPQGGERLWIREG